MLSLPLSTEDHKNEVDIIKHIAIANGYKSNIIDKIINKKQNRLINNCGGGVRDKQNPSDNEREVELSSSLHIKITIFENVYFSFNLLSRKKISNVIM